MEIVDAHIHLWTPETHPWVSKVEMFKSVLTYLTDDYKKDTEGHNVVQCVHVQAAWLGDPVEETVWLNGLADSTGTPNAIVGYCDLSSPDAEDILKRHSEHKRMRGIRQMLNFHKTHPEYNAVPHDDYLTDPNWIRGFALLEKYNLSFDLHILPGQMKRAAAVVRDHPRVMVMVNHCGVPYERDPESMRVWREGLQELSKCSNVYAKVSGMFFTDPKWNQQSIEDVVKPVLEIFGIDRCVFASNFPVDKINGTFQQLLSALEPILSVYSKEDQQKFYAGNARKFYKL
ncbi:uncharacterized protein y4mH-like isoform X1 [Halichondria panicea]|uniref:uncharacterized protein y4mH-like isoform X1 n=2 Tax=Halichondria panicea TaxID=6063 RepID=UPI00312B32E7